MSEIKEAARSLYLPSVFAEKSYGTFEALIYFSFNFFCVGY